MVSWLPARDPGFANLPEWYAIFLVVGYAASGYLIVVGLVMLARALITIGRKALSYDSIYSTAEKAHGEIVRQRLDNGRLSQAIVFLIDNISEAVFEIRDVSPRETLIDLILAPNGAVTPVAGQRLLVMDRRDGSLLGYVRVTATSSTSIRATLEEAEPLWLSIIHNTLSQRVPLHTTAIAILTEYHTTEATP